MKGWPRKAALHAGQVGDRGERRRGHARELPHPGRQRQLPAGVQQPEGDTDRGLVNFHVGFLNKIPVIELIMAVVIVVGAIYYIAVQRTSRTRRSWSPTTRCPAPVYTSDPAWLERKRDDEKARRSGAMAEPPRRMVVGNAPAARASAGRFQRRRAGVRPDRGAGRRGVPSRRRAALGRPPATGARPGRAVSRLAYLRQALQTLERRGLVRGTVGRPRRDLRRRAESRSAT